jgi:(p)ppGpp synthase/HD superfamily hydrolase
METLDKALMVASLHHQNQTYGVFPMMYHITDVVDIAKSHGFGGDILVACALHDAVEDSNLTISEIEKYFGSFVADIVWRVTDETKRNRKETKEATYLKLKGHKFAIAVKLCDRIANTRFSMEYKNKSMYKMYKKEYESFREALYDQSMDLGELWLELKKLYN